MKNTLTTGDELHKAYLQTDYTFTADDQQIIIRLDAANPALLAFLMQENISSWAYITAWNPTSHLQDEVYNQMQQQELLEHLADYTLYKGEGRGRDGSWPPEESYFIAGITKEKACALGADFGQTAILVSSEDGEPELVCLFE